MVSNQNKLTAVIADDELLARQGLCARLESFEQLSIIDTCSNGNDAFALALREKPDVLFLDIEMPGMDGMELVEHLLVAPIDMPYIVFTTGYNKFAVKAFEIENCDYLLKPINTDRLMHCVDKISRFYKERDALQKQNKLEQLLSRKVGKTLDCFLDGLAEQGTCRLDELSNTITFKSGSDFVRVLLADIQWIEAAGDYMCVHMEDDQLIIRKTMKQLEQELNPNHFPRINRSAIVNLVNISRLSPNSNGEYVALLHSGAQVKVSRKYKYKLEQLRNSSADLV